MNFREISDELAAKRADLAAIFDKHKTPAGELDMPMEVVEDVRRRNEELNDLGDKFLAAKAVNDIAEQNRRQLAEIADLDRVRRTVEFETGAGERREASEKAPALKSFGELFTESDIYQANRGRSRATYAVDVPMTLDEALRSAAVKTTMTTAAGWAAPNDRTSVVTPYAVRRPMVADLIPQVTTELSSIKYMEETTFTNNAAATAQNAQKPESALALTERTVPIEKIAHTLPVTDEQLDDVPGARAYIENRMLLMLALAEEAELLEGDGTTPNLTGFYNATGLQTQAKGADPTPDAVYKGITKVRHTGFADPTGTVWHPNDWQDVRLLRTADGIYIWGSPAEAGPERIWGLPAVITTANTENSVLVGDFQMYSVIYRKQGVTVEVGYVGDDFRYNRKTLRAEERLALVIYRGSAFCQVTGV
jgi:HK97 family phage major capsid protein